MFDVEASEGRIPLYKFHLGPHLLIKSAVQIQEGRKKKQTAFIRIEEPRKESWE